MALLIVAALLWVGVHVGIAGTRLRDAVVARIDEGPFRGLFSLVSILALAFLIWCWGRSATTPLWYVPIWLRWVLVAVMLLAFVLFVASVSDRNPTMIGGDPTQPPRGIQRVTRHPMLWSFALWAAVHIIGNGDSAAIVFFGLDDAQRHAFDRCQAGARRDPARSICSPLPAPALSYGPLLQRAQPPGMRVSCSAASMCCLHWLSSS